MQDLTLHHCEMLTIRYLCQLVEVLAHGARQDGASTGRCHDILTQISRLADRSEHIAQYALEGQDAGTRVECLADDLTAIELTLTDYAQELGRVRAGPNADDVRRLRQVLRENSKHLGEADRLATLYPYADAEAMQSGCAVQIFYKG